MMASEIGSGSTAESPHEPTLLAHEPTLFERTPVAHPLAAHEFVLLLTWTLLADLLIFRTQGFSGPAVFLATVPLLFVLRTIFSRRTQPRNKFTGAIIITLIVLLTLRLLWLGSALNIFSGIILIFALSMWAVGAAPLVLEGMAFAARVLMDGLFCVAGYELGEEKPANQLSANQLSANQSPSDPVQSSQSSDIVMATAIPEESRGSASSWMFPLLAVAIFGSIFVFANPDLLGSVSTWFSSLTNRVWGWIEKLSIWEIPFCLLALIIGAGLLRPLMPMFRFGPQDTSITITEQVDAPRFAGYRNTLLTLIALFGVYLVFEFSTLWGRDFPDGFYYAGYAHQGAAWLTFALLLATGLLSLVFGGSVLQDARLSSIRRLAWIWSAQNFLLAAAVYNRLMIYVGFNGMTRLRTVGFFGITLVVVGFALVLIKIAKNRTFWWLVRAQLLAFVVTVIVYGLFPVDWIAHRYNVAKVTKGYLHPSVMVAVKPTNNEGYLPLLSLTETDDPIIRRGVLAMLADKQLEIERMSKREPWHWTMGQASTNVLYTRLTNDQEKWIEFTQSRRARREAIADFKDYAMQWY